MDLAQPFCGAKILRPIIGGKFWWENAAIDPCVLPFYMGWKSDSELGSSRRKQINYSFSKLGISSTIGYCKHHLILSFDARDFTMRFHHCQVQENQNGIRASGKKIFNSKGKNCCPKFIVSIDMHLIFFSFWTTMSICCTLRCSWLASMELATLGPSSSRYSRKSLAGIWFKLCK